jgi:microcystin-dependent protein
MTTPFVGEIQLFGFNFAPYQWASCNGQSLAIQQNTALFSLLGTTYGGDGVRTFQLPNLATRGACNQGGGPGLSQRVIGETFGTPGVSLSLQQIPNHNHGFNVYNQPDTTKRVNKASPGNTMIVPGQADPFLATAVNAVFAPNILGQTGGNQPHENCQPYLAINYSIALYGAFPPFE